MNNFFKYITLSILVTLSGCTFKNNVNKKPSYGAKNNAYDKNHYKDLTIISSDNTNPYLEYIDFKIKKNEAVGYLVNPPKKNPSKYEEVILDKRYAKQSTCEDSLQDIMLDLYDDEVLNNSTPKCQHKKKVIQTKDFILKEESFKTFANWGIERFDHALISFLHSCNVFKVSRQEFMQNKNGQTFGKIQDWNNLCEIAYKYHKLDLQKEFFEKYTTPFLVKDSNTGSQNGTFTGYYLYEINVRKTKTSKFKYPIYKSPAKCKKNACTLTREEIESGALKDRNLEVLWTDSYLDLYMLQIQGSGIGVLDDGTRINILFDGKNQYRYASVFNKITQDEKFKTQNVNYKGIIDFLKKNDELLQKYSHHNKTYVFFDIKNDEVIGSSGAVLTSGRSIAIDPNFIPYGMPLWVETSHPVRDEDSKSQWIDFDKIVIAQDTGSAIIGKVRGDIYFGYGAKAEFLAKNTKFNGEYFMLLSNFAIPQSNE